TLDVVMGAQIIKMFPEFLKPLVARYCTNAPARMAQGLKLLGPLIQARLDEESQFGKESRPNDLISWLLDSAPGPEHRTVADLALQIMIINFAAIHTTSIALTTAIYCLAAHPQEALVLREEVETVVENEGWSKASMSKMLKLDSFVKESQRVFGTGATLMDRKVLRDFTFSDGTVIPAGCSISVATNATHLDEVNFVFRGL
ncbi:cytochrome P450, partial [Mycena floridula]